MKSAIHSVTIVKDGGYYAEEYFDDPSVTTDLEQMLAQKLSTNRLAGFVIEGITPYGVMTSAVRQAVLQRAIYAGLPVVRVGRGSPEGFADPHDYFIAGSNLTSTKARMLLMACLLNSAVCRQRRDQPIPTAEELAIDEESRRRLSGDFRYTLNEAKVCCRRWPVEVVCSWGD